MHTSLLVLIAVGNKLCDTSCIVVSYRMVMFGHSQMLGVYAKVGIPINL